MKPADLQKLIRRILTEEVEKQSITGQKIYERVPEVVHTSDYKKVFPYKRDDKSKNELLDDIDKVVKAISKDYIVVWDDHDDISIEARDLMRIRIIPKWENNYCIEIFTRNEDRVYITGQNWENVKNIVKDNLKNIESYVDVAYNKSIRNDVTDTTEKADKDLSQKGAIKTLPLTSEPVKTSKNKDKNYTEDAVKNEDDLPEKPMKEVGNFKKQIEYKVKDPVKIRKKKSSNEHIAK